MILLTDNAHFDYEPYPLCYVPNVLDSELYSELAENYPPPELFKYQPKLGNKHALSELRHPAKYRAFLRSSPVWSGFEEHLKSEAFIRDILLLLQEHNIDIECFPFRIRSRRGRRRASLWSRFRGRSEVSARFEFTMMDPDGGHILPHTDDPKKLITLVVSMMRPGEWNQDWGGGTDVVIPKDPSRIFNRGNRYMSFDDVDIVRTYPFAPNQCLLFIKTYNSWHQVTPIHAPNDAPMRKTLTINIERLF